MFGRTLHQCLDDGRPPLRQDITGKQLLPHASAVHQTLVPLRHVEHNAIDDIRDAQPHLIRSGAKRDADIAVVCHTRRRG